MTLSFFSYKITSKNPPTGFLKNFCPLVIGFKTTMTLSRSFLNGALAIAGITAAFGFATEAQAASLGPDFNGTVGQVTGSGFSVQVGDKLFSDFVVPTGNGQFQAGDAVNIIDNLPSFTVEFNPGTTGANNLSVAGTLSYKVTIVNPFINVFESFQTQTSAGGGTGRTAFRNTTVSSLVPSTLTTTNSGQSVVGLFPSGPKTISVSDSWSFGTGTARNITLLQSFIDQDPDDPTIPEPSAVLGLLALGLCGTLVGRQKKS